jgi:hypothetical protein
VKLTDTERLGLCGALQRSRDVRDARCLDNDAWAVRGLRAVLGVTTRPREPVSRFGP